MISKIITDELIVKAVLYILAGLLTIISIYLKSLVKKLENLNDTVSEVVTTNKVQGATCELKHSGVNARLDSHSDKIKELEKVVFKH